MEAVRENKVSKDGFRTYAEAVASGDYDTYQDKLYGKFDHVRLTWEDAFTRKVLTPHFIRAGAGRKSPFRVMDLGCGSGQGVEILSRMEFQERSLDGVNRSIMRRDQFEYLGVDLSPAMVEKGSQNYADQANIRFEAADLNFGLPGKDSQQPFDIYLSTYGSLSHLTRAKLVDLLADVALHARDGSLMVLDLLGRYSIEWPAFWKARGESEKVRDYTMKYLHLGNEKAMAEAEHFPLRFWTGDEIAGLARDVTMASETEVREVGRWDRSVLVGRHTDTREYNSALRPIRNAINHLHEIHTRTDFTTLRVDEDMAPRNAAPSAFLGELMHCWNILVEYTGKRMQKRIAPADLEGWREFPEALKSALTNMDRVVTSASWMKLEDPRAAFVEPQLGYALRGLEWEMQKGLGCGHGMLVVLEVRKPGFSGE